MYSRNFFRIGIIFRRNRIFSGLNSYYFYIRSLFFKIFTNSGNCSPCSDSSNHNINCSFTVFPYLRPCCLIVYLRISRICILIYKKNTIIFSQKFLIKSCISGNIIIIIFFKSLINFRNVTHVRHLGSERPHYLKTFFTHCILHVDVRFITFHCRNCRKSYTGIPTGCFQYSSAFFQTAVFLSFLYHAERNPVFYALIRVKKLYFSQNIRIQTILFYISV